MNMLAPTKLVDDLSSQIVDDASDTVIRPEALIRPDLNDAEAYINMGRPDDAELALNRAAALYRDLDMPNTSRRYRKLSREAAYMRSPSVSMAGGTGNPGSN